MRSETDKLGAYRADEQELMMTRPFEGIRVIDATHVLAGPFAAYQLAVLGADVIKVEHPDEPDQTRDSGTDHGLNRHGMGTSYLTQGSDYAKPEERGRPRDFQTAGPARRYHGRELPAWCFCFARPRLRGHE